METPQTCSERRMQDVSLDERAQIRSSSLSIAEIAKASRLTERQVKYLRSREGTITKPGNKAWGADDIQKLKSLMEEKGWAPKQITDQFPERTYTQVYRKMRRIKHNR